MPSFEDNLNFIFNTENKSGSAFYINKILNLIDELEKNTEKIDTFNEPKIEIQIKNLGKILSKFKKKINSIPTKVIWIQNEAEKLCKIIKKPEDISDKTLSLKSDILADKMSFCFTNLFFINDTLEYIKKRLNLLFKSNGKYYPSSVLSTLKDCLKKTEEYNILKLKHAQKKFEQSKELKDFMYGKRNPKLAHLLSLDSSVPVDSATPSKLMTPFGPVWIKRSSSDKSRMIYLIYLNQQCSRALKYDEMCEELDWKFNPNFNSKVKNLYRGRAIEGIIKPIISYINQPLDRGQNLLGTEANSSSPEYLFSLVKYNYPISKYLTKSQKEAAAFLCGVLLLSESHEFRNPTGGKFERKAMKNVLQLAEDGCTNPFSKVFSNAKGRYLPAGTGKMKNAKLIIEGKLNQRNAEELIKNYIKSEFKKFIDKNKNNLLNGDTVNLKEEFGGGSYKQIINFSRRGGVEKLKNFRNKINENNNTNLKNSFNNISISLDYIEKCKTLNDITLNDLPDEVQIMIKKEEKKINKLMNSSL